MGILNTMTLGRGHPPPYRLIRPVPTSKFCGQLARAYPAAPAPQSVAAALLLWASSDWGCQEACLQLPTELPRLLHNLQLSYPLENADQLT